MNEFHGDIRADIRRPHTRLHRVRVVVWHTLRAGARFVADRVMEDLARIVHHGRLFLGMMLTIIGVLSFTSDKYCDGNTSTYYACTRPSTYYFYPWWAILLCVIGSFSIVLWFLRKKTR